MRSNKLQLFVHFVWSTVMREPLITEDIETAIQRSIAAKAVKLGCKVIAIGGIEDHIHVFVEIPATIAISELARQMKGSSSHLANSLSGPIRGFGWDDSYGAFTVGVRQLNKVKYYVDHQRDHHRDGTLHTDFELTMDEDA